MAREINPERKKDLLGYIESLKTISDGIVEDEDLYAAGFDEDELESIGWFDPPEQLHVPLPVDYPEGVYAYDPTMRENANLKVRDFLEDTGWSKSGAMGVADGVVGSPLSPLGMGVSDLTPLGLPMGLQEGTRDVKAGWQSGDPARIASGAAGIAGSVPGGGLIVKGADAIGGKLLKQYDPNVTRTFFGPTSEEANTYLLDKARQLEGTGGWTPQEIWEETGWWNTPNGWRFEVSDHEMDFFNNFGEEALKGGAKSSISDAITHPDFWRNLKLQGKEPLGSFGQHSGFDLEGLPSKFGPSGYFSSGTNKIAISGRNEEELKDVLIHELQHYEQSHSGQVSKGANYTQVKEEVSKTIEQLPREALEYLATNTYYNTQLKSAEEALKVAKSVVNGTPRGWTHAGDDPFAVLDQIDEDHIKILEADIDDILSKGKKEHDEFVKVLGPKFAKSLDRLWEFTGGYSGRINRVGTWPDGQPDFSNSIKANDGWDQQSHRVYERNWGETEARVSAERRGMSPKEREKTFPGDSSEVKKYEEEGFWDSGNDFLHYLHVLKNDAEDFYDKTLGIKKGYAKGGVVEVDPISGNEVPPGAAPNEVRDDIDARLSEGEYVIPADVVRYIGLDKIEKLVEDAKAKLTEMDQKGRIGGEEVPAEDDLPFTDEELFSDLAPPVEMAVGGLVQPAGDRIINGMGTSVPLPEWMRDSSLTTPAVENTTPEKGNRPGQTEAVSKWDKDVKDWSPEQFSQAVAQRNNIGSQVIETGISSVIPFGKLAVRAKNRYIDRNAPKVIDQMLKSGTDVQGNPLSETQKAALIKAKEGFAATKGYQPGLGGAVINQVKTLIDRRTPEQKAKAEAEKKAKKEAREKAAKDRRDKNAKDRESNKSSKDDRTTKTNRNN